jgi:hypothetical protein
VALAAVTCAGLAAAGSQFPAGGYVAVALGGVGLLLGAASLLLPGRGRGAPTASTVLNGGLVGIVLIAPAWLGLRSWQPPPTDDPTEIKAVATGGGSAAPAEWVEAGAASWVRDDVRVAVVKVHIGPVELVGPKNQKRRYREPVLQIRLRVANVGVARAFEFTGWSANPSGKPEGVRLTDPAGKVVTAKSFDPTWRPEPADVPAKLFPGKSEDEVLYFVPPPAAELRLELPGAAVGSPDPVRFVIPRSALQSR